MKNIIFLISLVTFSFANQYTFLVDKYDEEIELEAKIISNIAIASSKNEIKLFIPRITSIEKNIYSKFFTLVNNCNDANFIYVKRNYEIDSLCKNKINNKLFFTNNYQKLLKKDNFIGAFFWNKSRPNIIFVKDRLVKQNIKLSKDYEKFIEDIK
ncbi:MAG: hypothetical protein U5K55_13940 [Aliarcobacter sp.]|nr:hypothetical protein [Aliarcobacter sp.]